VSSSAARRDRCANTQFILSHFAGIAIANFDIFSQIANPAQTVNP
jgi:hypothetical protein